MIGVPAGGYMKSCVTDISTNNKKEIGISMSASCVTAVSHLSDITCSLHLNL